MKRIIWTIIGTAFLIAVSILVYEVLTGDYAQMIGYARDWNFVDWMRGLVIQ